MAPAERRQGTRELPAITDHDDVWQMWSGWRTGKCAVCGERNNRHLSYGKELADILGGDPYDYIDAIRPESEV